MNEKVAKGVGVVGALLAVLIISGAVAGVASLCGAAPAFVMGAWYGGFVTSLVMALWGLSMMKSEGVLDDADD